MDDKYILLIEDNPNDEILARRALQKNSITNPLVVARDGVEAMEFLTGTGSFANRDARQLPALILLDLKLPRLDGLEVLRQLRAHGPTSRLPVVVLTSSDEENDVKRSYELGINSYIRKPVDFNEFVATVKQLSLYWLQIRDNVMQNNKDR
jgi:two-component system, response regulator